MMTDTPDTDDKPDDELKGLKAKNRELLGKNKTLATDLEKLREELDDIRSGLEETQAKKENDIEKALAARDAKHAKEKAAWEAKEKSLMAAIETHLIEGEAVSAISQADGISKLLLPHVKRRLKTVEENGQYRTVVLDQDGNPTDQKVTDLIGEFRKDADFSGAFRVSGVAAATGARPASSIAGIANPYARESFNLSEQATLERENPNRAAALRAAATSSPASGQSRTALRPVQR